MAEFHDSGLSKNEKYRIEVHQINSDYDKKIKEKSFFTSKTDIEAERKKSLKKVETDYFGRSGGGFVE